ncbi:MAG: hypothetical protein M3405_17705 [Acidobacteriota bacterium]|jgi:hypothetical protein|nr:hypothetical protein [Acidobacteriota bacterium]
MPFGKFIIIIIFCIALFAIGVSAQDAENQTVKKEDFKLNIVSKKITEENYKASVKVSAESASKPPVSVNVGVGVQAKNITVTLTQITGDVKFRGSLEKILQKLNLTKENPLSPNQQK